MREIDYNRIKNALNLSYIAINNITTAKLILTQIESKPAFTDEIGLGPLGRAAVGAVRAVPFYRKTAWRPQFLRLSLRMLILASVVVIAFLPNFAKDQNDPSIAPAPARLPTPAVKIADLMPVIGNLRWQPLGQPPFLTALMNFEKTFGDRTVPHRTVGLFVHLLTALLIWLVLRRLDVPAAWLATLVFAIHPGGVAAFARIDDHGRLWAAAFAAGSLLLLLQVLNIAPAPTDALPPAVPSESWLRELTRPWRRFWEKARFGFIPVFACLLALAASLCQPTVGIALGPIAALLLLWKQGPNSFKSWKAGLILLPFILLAGVAVAAGFGGDANLVPGEGSGHGINSFLPHTVWMIGWGSRWVLFPYPPSGRNGFLHLSVGPTTLVLGLLLLVAIGVAAIFRRRVGIGVAVALLCYLVLVPTIYVPLATPQQENSQSAGGEGETYLLALPLLALAAAILVAASRRLTNPGSQSGIQLGVGVAVVAGLSYMTFAEAKFFERPEQVLEAELAAHPNSSSIRAELAQLYIDEANLESAAKVLSDQKPDQCTDASLAIAEGHLLSLEDRPAAAIVWLERAATLEPNNPDVPDRLALVDVQLGQTKEATEIFKHAIELHPADVTLRNDYGVLLTQHGDFDAAKSQFDAALKAQANFAPAHVGLAILLVRQNKLDEAGTEYKAALKADPTYFDAAINYGVILARQHKFDLALPYLGLAVRLRPTSPEAHNDFGIALSATGRLKRAITEFQRAVALRPSYSTAASNLQKAELKFNEVMNGF